MQTKTIGRLIKTIISTCICGFILGGQSQLLASPEPISSLAATPMDGGTSVFVAQLDEQVPRLLAKNHLPGASIALVRTGEVVWAKGYGFADAASSKAVTPDTVFRVASISKTVTAWAVMRMVEQGKVDLNAPVEKYLTRWRLPPSQFDNQEVTVFRLLSHTAGLNVHGYGRGPRIDPPPSLEQSLTNTGVQVVQQPGSGYRYSGGGYTVLQLMIEEVTGEPFADYVQTEILNPLGMERSSFYDSPDVLSHLASAYDEHGQPYPPRRYTEQAAAGLYATAPDLARMIAAMLPGPRGEPAGRGVLRPGTLQLMFTPAPATDGGYGLGYQTGYDKTQVVMNSGDNPGWESVFVALPEINEGIICLTNSDTGETFNAELIQRWSAWLNKIYTSDSR